MEEKDQSIQEQMEELERKKLELENQRLEFEKAKLKHEQEQLENQKKEQKNEKPAQQKSSSGGCMIKGCVLIIIGLIGLFILVAVVGGPYDDNSSRIENMSTTELERLARNYAENEWKKHLKDPRSYERIYDVVTDDGLGSYIVYVRYRAKNSLGAYDIGFFKYKITFDGDICRQELLDYSK